MTIIVAKDGVMCADSIFSNGQIMALVAFPKIVRLPNGSLIGAAGYAADCWNAFQWFLEGESIHKNPFLIGDKEETELDMLLMKPDGSIWRSARTIHGFYPMPNGSTIGVSTGCIIAEAAMRLGRSAQEATELAIEMTAGLGRPVQVERLELR